MVSERIEEGFEVFVADGDKPFGAVRLVRPHGRAELLVYVENAGEFVIALSAVDNDLLRVDGVDGDKLDPKLRRAIGHAHDAEDPRL